MRVAQAWVDEGGASAIEFGLTIPAFVVVLFAIIEGGLLLWTQVGMQHGAEMAARCASVNTTLCSNANATQNYAAQQAYGLNLPSSTFTVSTPSCGNQVSAMYAFRFVMNFGLPTLTLNAQACFPK